MERKARRHSIAAMFRQPAMTATSRTWQIKEPPPTCDTNEARRLHYQAEAEIAFEATLQTHLHRLRDDTTRLDQDEYPPLTKRLRRLEDANRMLARPMTSERLRIHRDGGQPVDTTLQAEFNEFRDLIDAEEVELQDLFRDLDEVNREIAKTISSLELELDKSEAAEQSRNVPEVQAIERAIAELGRSDIERLKSEENKRRRKQKVIFEALTELAE